MKLFGGTYLQLKTEFPSLGSNNTGQAIYSRTLYTYTNYVDMTIYVYKQLSGSKACVVQISGRTTNQYKKTMTHEIGHLLGWSGHSSNSNDIMYSSGSSITTLTLRDKNHLSQIYDLFY
jgi:predicted Zn-dependent protease